MTRRAALSDTAAAARAVAAAGYGGLKFDPFWGLGRDPGPRRASARHWTMSAAVRAAVGPDVQVFVDGHGRFSVGTASRLAHALAEIGVDWFEEPVEPENYIALGQVARPRGTSDRRRRALLFALPGSAASSPSSAGHIVLQPDPIQVGGLLEAKKISVLADLSLPAGVLPLPVWPDRDRRDPSTLCRDDQRRPPGDPFRHSMPPGADDAHQQIARCPSGGSYPVSALPGLGHRTQ